VEFRNSGRSLRILEVLEWMERLGVMERNGNGEEWKWTGSPLTVTIHHERNDGDDNDDNN
jgi:hypothetical protein